MSAGRRSGKVFKQKEYIAEEPDFRQGAASFDVIGLTSERIYSGPPWWSCRILTHKGNHMVPALVFPLFASDSCLSPVTYMNTDQLTPCSRRSVSVGGTIWAFHFDQSTLVVLSPFKYQWPLTVGMDQPFPKLQADLRFTVFFLQYFLCSILMLMLCTAGFLGFCNWNWKIPVTFSEC